MAASEGSLGRVCIPSLTKDLGYKASGPISNLSKGPVTDYASSMVQWMRHRQPRYKGGVRMEMERPSPSYIVDVCSFNQDITGHEHDPF